MKGREFTEFLHDYLLGNLPAVARAEFELPLAGRRGHPLGPVHEQLHTLLGMTLSADHERGHGSVSQGPVGERSVPGVRER
jgi:hypothetical protein